MTKTIDFQNPQWVARALRVHELVSTEIKRYFEQEHDRFFEIEQGCNRALKLLNRLDTLLGSDIRVVEDYAKNHQALFELVKKLELESFIDEKIREEWGEDCFLMNFFSKHPIEY